MLHIYKVVLWVHRSTQPTGLILYGQRVLLGFAISLSMGSVIEKGMLHIYKVVLWVHRSTQPTGLILYGQRVLLGFAISLSMGSVIEKGMLHIYKVVLWVHRSTQPTGLHITPYDRWWTCLVGFRYIYRHDCVIEVRNFEYQQNGFVSFPAQPNLRRLLTADC